MLVAQALVLHRMRAFGSDQMQDSLDTQTAALRFVFGIRAGMHGQRVFGCFAGAHKTASHQMRQCIHQRALHQSLFLLQTPAPGLTGNTGKSVQGAQCQMQHHK